MTDEQGLLAAICAYPDDDTPRMVFADWLEENGQSERAEFIRVQVELSRTRTQCDPNCIGRSRLSDKCGSYVDVKTMKPVPCQDCWRELRQRERELLRIVWFSVYESDPLQHFVCSGVSFDLAMMPRVEFRRGFIESVTCSWSDWLRHWATFAWRPAWKHEVPCSFTGDKKERYDLRYFSIEWGPCKDGKVWVSTEHERSDTGGIEGGTNFGRDCPKCKGTGRIKHTMPVSVQPIDRVVLTTMPGWFHPTANEQHSDMERGSHLWTCTAQAQWACEKRWPGIVFDLSRAEPGVRPIARGISPEEAEEILHQQALADIDRR